METPVAIENVVIYAPQKGYEPREGQNSTSIVFLSPQEVDRNHKDTTTLLQKFKASGIGKMWMFFIHIDLIFDGFLMNLMRWCTAINVFRTVLVPAKVTKKWMIGATDLFTSTKEYTLTWSKSTSVMRNIVDFSLGCVSTTMHVKNDLKKPQSNPTCITSCVRGMFIGCCIVPEFILRNFIGLPLITAVLILLILTTWLALFAVIPCVLFLWIMAKLMFKVSVVCGSILLFLFSTLILIPIAVIFVYFFIGLILTFVVGVRYVVYPILLLLRCVVFLFVALVYFPCVGYLKLKKQCVDALDAV
jgi:hypothetical protein